MLVRAAFQARAAWGPTKAERLRGEARRRPSARRPGTGLSNGARVRRALGPCPGKARGAPAEAAAYSEAVAESARNIGPPSEGCVARLPRRGGDVPGDGRRGRARPGPRRSGDLARARPATGSPVVGRVEPRRAGGCPGRRGTQGTCQRPAPRGGLLSCALDSAWIPPGLVTQAVIVSARIGDWPQTLTLAAPAIRGLLWVGTDRSSLRRGSTSWHVRWSPPTPRVPPRSKAERRGGSRRRRTPFAAACERRAIPAGGTIRAVDHHRLRHQPAADDDSRTRSSNSARLASASFGPRVRQWTTITRYP